MVFLGEHFPQVEKMAVRLNNQGGNHTLCIPGTLGLKRSMCPFLLLCVKYAHMCVNGNPVFPVD